jgi:hypothetical protein
MMLNYNGEAHNLIQRRRKVFNKRANTLILLGDKPAKWITEGVPAVKKERIGD